MRFAIPQSCPAQPEPLQDEATIEVFCHSSVPDSERGFVGGSRKWGSPFLNRLPQISEPTEKWEANPSLNTIFTSHFHSDLQTTWFNLRNQLRDWSTLKSIISISSTAHYFCHFSFCFLFLPSLITSASSDSPLPGWSSFRSLPLPGSIFFLSLPLLGLLCLFSSPLSGIFSHSHNYSISLFICSHLFSCVFAPCWTWFPRNYSNAWIISKVWLLRRIYFWKQSFRIKLRKPLEADKKHTDFSRKHVKNHIYERFLS